MQTRYSGVVGFKTDPVQSSPGVLKPHYIERRMKMTELSKDYHIQNESTINDTLTTSNRVSIVMDQYSFENASNIAYVSYMNRLWKVSTVEIDRPNITLYLGAVFVHSKGDIVN